MRKLWVLSILAVFFFVSAQSVYAVDETAEPDPCAYYSSQPGYAACKDRFEKIERMKKAKQNRQDRNKAKRANRKIKTRAVVQQEAEQKKQKSEEASTATESGQVEAEAVTDHAAEADEVRDTVEKLRQELQESNRAEKPAGDEF